MFGFMQTAAAFGPLINSGLFTLFSGTHGRPDFPAMPFMFNAILLALAYVVGMCALHLLLLCLFLFRSAALVCPVIVLSLGSQLMKDSGYLPLMVPTGVDHATELHVVDSGSNN